MQLILFPQPSMSEDLINIKVTLPSFLKKDSTYMSGIAPVSNLRTRGRIFTKHGR